MDTQISVPAADKQMHVVALGSSFAAGPGIPPQIDKTAMRSGQNYAHFLSERLGARLTDLTVSGATLKNVLDEPQVFFRTTFPPQLSKLPPDADVVTITGGGNDMNYVGAMLRDTIGGSLLGRLFLRFLPIPASDYSVTAQHVADRFVAVIDGIWKQAPECRVILVEYLTLLGTHVQPGKDVALTAEQMEKHKKAAVSLQTVYRLAKEARPAVELVPIAELSSSHGLGSEEPWVDGCNMAVITARKTPFHPNVEGMRNVANALYERLK